MQAYAHAYKYACMDIKALRKELGLTQSQLGDKLGLTQATVSRLESGEIKVDAVMRLALEHLRLKAAA